MKYFLSFLIIIVAVILQASFLPHFRIYHVIPNLFLLVVVSWVLLHEYRRAYLWGFFGGLLLDLNSEMFYGISSLSLLLLVFALFFTIKNFINADNLTSKILVVFLSTLIYKASFIFLLLLAHFFNLYESLNFLSKNIIYFLIVEMALNTLAIFLIYPFIKKFHNFVLQYEAKVKKSQNSYGRPFSIS